MDSTLKQAFIYWHVLGFIDACADLEKRNMVPDGIRDKAIHGMIEKFSLEESYAQLDSEQCRERLAAIYGTDMDTCPLPICKAMLSAKKSAGVDPWYRSFAEILVLNQSELSSSYALQHWLRSRNTLELLSIWERKNNLAFQQERAAAFIQEAHNTNTTVTLKRWIAQTNAIGIIAVPGRYGGTYADQIIANDFESWLSPEHRYLTLTLRETR